jgi:hypothetical protein
LKENWRGSSSGNESPHTGQAKRSEKTTERRNGGRFSSRHFRRLVVSHDLHNSIGRLQRRLDRVVETAPIGRADHEPVHHDRDVVVLPAIERRDLAQVVGLAVHPHPHEATLADVLEQLAEFALAAAHHRRQHLDPGLIRPAENGLGDLRRALPGDRGAVVRAMRHPGPGPEEPQIVVDLGDGADGGARILAGGLLLDRDGGREPLDRVHVRLFHQAEELTGVGRQRFDVAPLSLGVDRVEGERRLPRSGEAGDDGEPVSGDGDGDVLEVVLAGAAHHQVILSHSPERYPKTRPRVNGFRFRWPASTIHLPS